VKRKEVRRITEAGAVFVRQGGKHAVYENPRTNQTIAETRNADINDRRVPTSRRSLPVLQRIASAQTLPFARFPPVAAASPFDAAASWSPRSRSRPVERGRDKFLSAPERLSDAGRHRGRASERLVDADEVVCGKLLASCVARHVGGRAIPGIHVRHGAEDEVQAP
jgi:hypothetical protein